MRERLQSDTFLQNSVKERDALPIARMKSQLMEAITENNVIIIRGNTGCGKTTQVKLKKIWNFIVLMAVQLILT